MLIVYYSVPADRMRTYGNKELCFIHECILGTYDSTWDEEVIQNLTHTVASKALMELQIAAIYMMLYHVKSHY